MARPGKQADFVSMVEAAYQIEQSTDGWLNGILSAAAPGIDCGLGVFAHCYDASETRRLVVTSAAHRGLPDGFAEGFVQQQTQLNESYVRKGYRSLSSGTASEVPGWSSLPFLASVAERFQVRDALVINGVNPDGHGCAIHAFLPQETTLTQRRRSLLSKLSCHLAAAFRLRRRLASGNTAANAPEAILDRDGKVHHAEGEARSKSALSRLKRSALAMARSRGTLRTSAPEQAVDEWKGLIAARWTLLDVAEEDGGKYLVARQNRPAASGSTLLTDREQEVVALAAIGHHNKLIAYNLGISHSTVRVLMARAARKLKAHSREDLILHWTLGAAR